MVDTEEMDPELARYLNRNYWQQKSEIKTTNVPTTTPSAPVVTTEQKATEGGKVVIEVCEYDLSLYLNIWNVKTYSPIGFMKGAEVIYCVLF